MSQSEKRTEVTGTNILCFGHHGAFEGIGGSARLINMLEIFKRLRTSTQLISYLPDKKFGVTYERRSEYLSIRTIHVPSSLPKVIRLPALLLLLFYGLRYVGKTNVIFSHGPSIVYGLPALILSKIFRKPLLIDHPDIRDSDTPKFIYDSVIRNSDIVFTVSRYLEEEVKQIGCRKVVHVPGFIDADVFQNNASERARIRKELNIGTNEVAIGYAGAFSPHEGLSFLLKAFNSLSNRYENVKLVLVGGRNVPGSDEIVQLTNELALKGKVILIPRQPYELMPGYLSALDIACSPKVDCPANRAADPIRVYEYMSVGLPVVASAMGETSNVIESGYDGFLVKPGDEDELKRILEYLVQNLDSLQEVRTKAREKVIKNYSHQATLEKIRVALENLRGGS